MHIFSRIIKIETKTNVMFCDIINPQSFKKYILSIRVLIKTAFSNTNIVSEYRYLEK